MRIGFYGGSFDPPHNAHVALAQAAVAQLQLDQLLIIPTGIADYKTRALSPTRHRLHMAQLAFAAVPQAHVDPRELNRPGPSYTIDTVRQLQLEKPEDQLFLVLGADQFATFEQWHEWQAIAQATTICVAHRPGLTIDTTCFDVEKQMQIFKVQLPPMHISSTGIRQRVMQGETIADLVPAKVASYISQHQLYYP